MSKRKEIDEDESHQYHKKSEKVDDFHKKSIDIHPSRLHELNHQFVSSITSQLSTEPYSVLVGNYSPWLADRLKQSRSNIVNSLQETIDIYRALANQNFDCLFDTQVYPPVSSSSVATSTNPSSKISTDATIEETDDESNQPLQSEKVESEIDGNLIYRCRMEVNQNGRLIEHGPVQVILKERNGKHQLIVLSDDSLRRLYLNIFWLKKIEKTKSSIQDITFLCQQNPSMSGIKQVEFVMILFHFNNEIQRNNAYHNLERMNIIN